MIACASVPACVPNAIPPFYCAHHARLAGVPVAEGTIGVHTYGFRIVDCEPDFAFTAAEPGRRFVPARGQGERLCLFDETSPVLCDLILENDRAILGGRP